MATNNGSIWGRLWESTEGDLVTIRLPRALAEELLSALSIGVDSGDGMDDMEPDNDDGEPDADDDTMDLDGDDDDGDVDMLLVRGDDDDDDDDDEDDLPRRRRESSTYDQSGGDPSGMRPKTALGEKYVGFDKLKGKLKGVEDPGGLAADIGRKKYGKGKFQAAAAKGKKLG